MSDATIARLTAERKEWRVDPPVGFYAKPLKNKDNSTDLMNWELGIPGREGTDWAGGLYKVYLNFPKDYPTEPPECKFNPVIFHPNVFSSGHICLDLLKSYENYRPGLSVKQLAVGIQELLDNPNPASPANSEASTLFQKKKADYKKRIKAQAAKFVSDI
eukprot:gene7663-10428_t